MDGLVLITKDPAGLWHSAITDEVMKKTVLHCTITGWGGTDLEPGVENPDIQLAAYDNFVSVYGSERIVLRIDPVIPTERGVGRALRVQREAKGRVRISFLDLYRHVRKRLNEGKHFELLEELEEVYGKDIHAPLKWRRQYADLFGRNVEICGEPGLNCSGCVSLRDLQVMGLPPPEKLTISKQRKECKCLAIKTEMLKHRQRCRHQCLYCYWR
jgi:hypothetical protein